jgi:hypothetical protein
MTSIFGWERRESSSRESPAAIEQWIIDGPVSGLISNEKQ